MSYILPVETLITVCFEWFYCFDWGERIAYEHTGRFTLQKSNALPNWDMLLGHDLNKNLRQWILAFLTASPNDDRHARDCVEDNSFFNPFYRSDTAVRLHYKTWLIYYRPSCSRHFFYYYHLKTRDEVSGRCRAIGGCKSAKWRSSFVLSIRNGLGFFYKELKISCSESGVLYRKSIVVSEQVRPLMCLSM